MVLQLHDYRNVTKGIENLVNYMTIVAIIALAVILALIIVYKRSSHRGSHGWSYSGPISPFHPERAAGRKGELKAELVIESVLQEGDVHLTNIAISYNGQETELDNVIVNRKGVFIIEVKNYSGMLAGDIDDYEWRKTHVSSGGNAYTKTVKNPIRQVKRQIYILAHYLDYYGVRVWVEGFAYFTRGNSPVASDRVLQTPADIDHAIHGGKKQLSQQQIQIIREVLE